MRSIHRLVFLLPALVIALSSCCKDDPFTATRSADDYWSVDPSRAAYVRVIAAASTAPGTIVYFDSLPSFRNRAQHYLRFVDNVNEARYYPVDTATRSVEFRIEDGSTLASLDRLELRHGKFYTLYLHGREETYGVLKTMDEPTPTPGTSAVRMRAVHLAPGTPTLNISFAENGPPIFRNVAYGTATDYVTIPRATEPVGLFISDASGNRLFTLPPGYVVFFTDQVNSLVMTGSVAPQGAEPFLSFAVFNEAFFDRDDSLFGGAHIPISFGAVRFANLMPMGFDRTTNENRALTVAILDPSVAHYAPNEYFRRNFLGQDRALVKVYPLGNNMQAGEQKIGKYMLLRPIRYPWRIERGVNTGPSPYHIYREPARGRGFEFRVASNTRHTIIAYGDTVYNNEESKVLVDNMRAPVPGTTAVRLFHGAYDPVNRAKRLRLRIGGVESRAMIYGELPHNQSDVIDVPAGSTRLELVDESGTVIHTQTLEIPLEANEAYTIYLSRGAFGTSLVLTEVSEKFELVY